MFFRIHLVEEQIIALRPWYYNLYTYEETRLTMDEMRTLALNGYEIEFFEGPNEFNEFQVGETRRTFVNRRGYFTVAEMAQNTVAFERMERPKAKWACLQVEQPRKNLH